MQLVVQTVVDIGNFGFQLCDEVFLVFFIVTPRFVKVPMKKGLRRVL